MAVNPTKPATPARAKSQVYHVRVSPKLLAKLQAESRKREDVPISTLIRMIVEARYFTPKSFI